MTLTARPGPDRVLTGARAHRRRARSRPRRRRGHRRRDRRASPWRASTPRCASSSAASSRCSRRSSTSAADMLVATQLATAATWDAARTEPGTPEFELAAAVAGAAGAARVRDVRGEEHPAPRRHRVHVGARRAHLPQARRGAGGGVRSRRQRSSSTSRGSPARGSRCARGRAPARGRDVPHRGARVRRAVPRHSPKPSSSGFFLDSGYALAHWPEAVGPRRGRGRAARDRGGAARPPACGRRSTGSAAGSSRRSPSTPIADQIERWIRPSLEYEYTWCQLF